MDIKKTAEAGTVESSDILIKVKPTKINGISIDLESDVEKQYGNSIKQVIKETAQNMGVKKVYIQAQDKGALDYVIKARTETALQRAK